MRRWLLAAVGAAFFLAAIAALFSWWERQRTEETIKFFPLDREAVFTEAKTTLALATNKERGRYSLRWSTISTLNRRAYLRQDVSLLFADGRLVDVLSRWETNTGTIAMEKQQLCMTAVFSKPFRSIMVNCTRAKRSQAAKRCQARICMSSTRHTIRSHHSAGRKRTPSANGSAS